MPVEEIAGGVLKVVTRALGWILFEFVLSLLIRGLGYFICRPFKKADIEGGAELIVGVIAWTVIIGFAYYTYPHVVEFLDVDRCLDGGGRYNHEIELCEYS
ncbi:hypothetical protein ACWU4D_12640 [Vibrio sp. WJH972]